MPQRHYFDHNATTPVHPAVLEAMLPCLGEVCGNASSIHGFGQDARRLVETARRKLAALLDCDPKDLVFTSGGTESDNLAIFGSLAARDDTHVITSSIEHPAVLNVCQRLEKDGVAVTWLPAGADGVVSPDDVRAALRPQTALITVMTANNEIGTLQPIDAIARIAREAEVAFHTDAVQAVGRIPLSATVSGVDLLALSGHKLYGPKGVGALYIRRGFDLEPTLFGGKHERGRRPGTENVPGIVGLGAAAELAAADLEAESARLAGLRDRLEQSVLDRIPDCWVNAGQSPRTPNTTNIGFRGLEGEALVIALDLKGFAVSSGAACSSGAVEPSHVLTAIGLSRADAKSCLRFSLGRENDEAQVDALVDALAEVTARLRRLSPVGTQ